MKLSAEAKRELDDITYFLLCHTDHILNGTLKVYMTPLTHFPYSISLFHPEINDSESETERINQLFRKIDLNYLRDLMIDEKHGAWFSMSFEIDCDANWNLDIDDREVKIVFNYDKRFNVLADDWVYDPKDLVFPTVDYFMEDLAKHPRSPENYPSCLSELVAEEKRERPHFAAANLKEVFAKNFAVQPEMIGVYAPAINSKPWVSLWKMTALAFEKQMMTEKYRSRPFIDPRYEFMKRDSIIWSTRDLSDLIAQKHADANLTVMDARLYNGSTRLYSTNAHFGSNFDLKDLDPDNVRRAFAGVVYDVIMLQNEQRFPELFEEN